jgi:hypothetical protein
MSTHAYRFALVTYQREIGDTNTLPLGVIVESECEVVVMASGSRALTMGPLTRLERAVLTDIVPSYEAEIRSLVSEGVPPEGILAFLFSQTHYNLAVGKALDHPTSLDITEVAENLYRAFVDSGASYGTAVHTRARIQKLHPSPALSVISRAREVFGSQQRAVAWLTTPNPALGNCIPEEILNDPDRRQSVLDLLGRIEHGVHS